MKAIKDDLKMSGNLNKGSKGGQGFRLLRMVEKKKTRKKSMAEDLKDEIIEN